MTTRRRLSLLSTLILTYLQQNMTLFLKKMSKICYLLMAYRLITTLLPSLVPTMTTTTTTTTRLQPRHRSPIPTSTVRTAGPLLTSLLYPFLAWKLAH